MNEATSTLDRRTECEVMVPIEALLGDKAILVIARRLSTVKVSDCIVMLE